MNHDAQVNILVGKRIFVVEDDILNARVFYKCLAKHGAFIYDDILGYGILQHIIDSLPIDMVILDIQLARGNNGYEVFNSLKKHSQLMGIPVVAVTSLDPETYIPIAKKMGFDGYFSKPINAIEFPHHLARIFNGENIWLVSR
jgi:two-component system, cell cycle response regulator DivK